MNKNRKIFLSVGVLGALVALWTFSTPSDETEEGEIHAEENHLLIKLTEEQMAHLGIHLKEALPGNITTTLTTRGKVILHPDKLAHVLPKIAGVVKEARKNIGDTVKQGEVIAVLESREIADLKAEYLAAIEKCKLACTLFEREGRLHEKRVSAEQDFLSAQLAYEEAKITLQLIKQKLRAFELGDREITLLEGGRYPDLRLYEIRSPIEGTIINRHLTQGEFVESTTPIYEIANLENVWIEMGIYPKDLWKIKVGQRIEATLPFEKRQAEAKIIYISPVIKEETITARAVAELSNLDLDWRPGTFVKTEIVTDSIHVPVLVSNEAIQTIEGKEVVFVATSEGFETRAVQTGKSDNSCTEIISGLTPGERYAASQTFFFKAELGKETAEQDD